MRKMIDIFLRAFSTGNGWSKTRDEVEGLTFADFMEQTPSRLCAMIYAAHAVAGEDLTPAVARAHAEYLASLKVIADRLKAEKSQSTDNIKLALGAQ